MTLLKRAAPLVILLLLLGSNACMPTNGVLELPPQVPKVLTPNKTTDTSTQTPKKQPTKSTKALGTPFNTNRLTSRFTQVKRDISTRYKTMFRRTSLGFDDAVFSDIWNEVQGFALNASKLPKALKVIRPITFVQGLIPISLAILFASGFIIIGPILERIFTRAQSRISLPQFPIRVTQALRMIVWLMGFIGPAAFFLVLSYVPIGLMFSPATWTLMLQETFWVILALRGIIGVAEISMAIAFTHLPDEAADRLRHRISKTVQGFCLLIMLPVALNTYGYSEEIKALSWFVFEVMLAIGLLLAFWRRTEDVSLLLPTREDRGPLMRTFARFIERIFKFILGGTSLLILLLATGYEQGASFILWRSYTFVALVAVVFWVMHNLRRYMHYKEELEESNRAQADLIRSIRRLLSMALMLFLIITSLDLFHLYDPLEVLLKSPLLILQNVDFSVYNALSAVVIVGTAALLSKLLRVGLNAQVYPTFKVDVGVAYAVNTIVNYLIIVIGFFLVLVALGVNLAAVTVVAASLSVGIGFGLQTITENLISGLILLFGQAVQKGDYVTVGTIYGRVEAVGARSVVVRTMDNYEMLIPSKELVNGSIINWSYRDPYVRLHIPVGVSYDADPRVVERVLLEAAQKHEYIMKKPAPQVWFTGFGASSIDFSLLVYFDCNVIIPDQLKGQVYFDIWDALAEANIEIPFPQQDLHLRSLQFSEDDMARLQSMRAQREQAAPVEPEEPNQDNSTP